MEIKFKDNPVTIKTIEVGGKKLTKQFLQQVPLERINFIIDELNSVDETYSYEYMYYNTEDISKHNFELNGKLIGWFNLKFENTELLSERLGFPVVNYLDDIILILFINNKGELNRSYIESDIYKAIFADKYPQIYV